MSQRWDIFCRVIDNFGDIGVCWRLARQLAAEYGFSVRLWVDDLVSLRTLCHAVATGLDQQSAQGVEIRWWPDIFPEVEPADVVIEAFACELPPNYLVAMVQKPPVWINLEYLSAEPWVEDFHLKPSPHPLLPLTKFFFFPGFTGNTGGLLRESYLSQGIDSQNLWTQLGMQEPSADAIKISLFGYENAAVGSLLQGWRESARPVACLLPAGRLLPQISAWAGLPFQAGQSLTQGNLSLHVLPFLEQEDYDRLLWACDCNFVRGEDSFVRAQWAGQPLVWHIYPQEEGAHWKKLEAFLDLYCTGLPDNTAQDLREFWRCWNAQEAVDWRKFHQHMPVLHAHARQWKTGLSSQKALLENLVFFCKNKV